MQGANETAGTKIFDGLIFYDPIISDDGKRDDPRQDCFAINHFGKSIIGKAGVIRKWLMPSQDPSVILKDIIDKYNSTIDYNATSSGDYRHDCQLYFHFHDLFWKR